MKLLKTIEGMKKEKKKKEKYFSLSLASDPNKYPESYII